MGALSPLGVEMSPMLGALAMSLSSLFVVCNALRLGRFKEMVKDQENAAKTEEISVVKEDENMEITLKIEGMMCHHCEAHVKKALEAVDGVEMAVADHESGTAKVTLSKETDVRLLEDAVIDEGYKIVK